MKCLTHQYQGGQSDMPIPRTRCQYHGMDGCLKGTCTVTRNNSNGKQVLDEGRLTSRARTRSELLDETGVASGCGREKTRRDIS
jgi:hypothetical protein